MLNFFRYHGTKLNVKELDFEGVVADKIAALLDVLAHQDTEQPVRLARIIELYVQQRPRGRIHSRLPKLVGVHLAQAFEPLYFDSLAADFPYGRADFAERSNIKVLLGTCQMKFGC